MVSYDFTGVDEAFKSRDNRFMVFETGQPLEFNVPVYGESIEVYRLIDGEKVPLVAGTHFDVGSDQRDLDAMSDAKLRDEYFNKLLVNGITIIEPVLDKTEYQVSISYQKLRLSPSEENHGDVGPEYSPGLMLEIIETVNYLKDVKNPVNDITSDSLDVIRTLDVDTTGLHEPNHVFEERHYVDVLNNKQVIQPDCGAFYEHDLVIVVEESGEELVLGKDYTLAGLDHGRIKTSDHESGIYQFVFLTTELEGNLLVNYRAYGGHVTKLTIAAIKKILADLVKFISANNYLTDKTLGGTKIIRDMNERLLEMEDVMRHYNVAVHQFTAPDNEKHWFSIAELYRMDWSTSTIPSDLVQLKLASEVLGWAFDVSVQINLERRSSRMQVNTIGSIDKVSHFDMSHYENVLSRNIPELRVVWRDVDGALSGAVLQIGIGNIDGRLIPLTVVNKSGNSSYVSLREPSDLVATSNNDNIVLPDGNLWKDGGEACEVARSVLCHSDGYLAWAGSLKSEELANGAILNHIIGRDDFSLGNVKGVSFYFYDRIRDKVIISNQDHFDNDAEVMVENVFFFAEDLCSISYHISRTSIGEVVLYVKTNIGTHSENNSRFDLRQIVFNM